MHMADALVSPAVGGTLWAVSAGLLAHGARKVRRLHQGQLVPLMGVLGAFVFTAQMINFAIPGTGSSGHLGGGLILAILLGPHAAFLVMASVLTVQAFFFADGGLLALGCNIFNLGFFPAFVAYPLVYRTMVNANPARASLAAVVASIVGLQLGALAVVVQTLASGISELPFHTFALLMSPIHLAIGLVEGFATAAVVAVVARSRPETFSAMAAAQPLNAIPSSRGLRAAFLVAAILIGGAGSWFASSQPDGLEWALAKATGTASIEESSGAPPTALTALQQRLALLPDYAFRGPPDVAPETTSETWPAVNAGTSTAGLVGGGLTLALAGLLGLALKPTRGVMIHSQ